MNSKHPPFDRQKGIVLPLVAVALVALLGMAGIGMEMGLAFLSKTRIQNAMDAAALSGAKSLNSLAGNESIATADALTAFNFYSSSMGGITPSIEFCSTQGFSSCSGTPRYIRVSISNVPSDLYLSRALPGIDDQLMIGGSAVAGPIPTVPCNLAPLVVSTDSPPDTDCTDGACYGYTIGQEVILKTGSGGSGGGGGKGGKEPEPETETSGPGNYNLLRLGGPGGADVRQNLAGGYAGCPTGNVETEPGNTVGPTAQGLNTRFGVYQGGNVSAADYPPDVVTTENISYAQYQAALLAGNFNFAPPDGVPGRRLISIVFSDFNNESSGGTNNIPVNGIGCMFLTRQAAQGGDQEIYGEFVGDCLQAGQVAENPDETSTTQKIVLYDDFGSNDS